MNSNKNEYKPSFISGYEIKNIPTLIQALKSSLEYQKIFIEEIEQKFQYIFAEIKNNKNLDQLLIYNFLDAFAFIIKELGIPFAHNLLQTDIFQDLTQLYFEEIEKNNVKLIEKISNLLDTWMDVFKYIVSNDHLNKIRQYLIEIQIIKDKNEISDNKPKDEETIYENFYALLNGLKTLKEIGKDKEKLEELDKKYEALKKEIRIFNIKSGNENQASKDFFNSLIKELNEHFNELNSDKVNNNIIININEIPENKKEEIVDIPLYKRTFFYFDEKIKEIRNEVIEFKSYSFPLTKVDGDEIKRQICGFLNSQGGRLYIGINSQNEVKGIALDSKSRDITRNALVNLTYEFYPNCRIDKIFVYFIPVKNPSTKEFISKRYVIKIRVYPGDPEVLYSMTSVGYHSTIRKGCNCYEMNSTEIYNEIITRDEIKKLKNIDNAFLKESKIKDPEPEVNLNEDDIDDDDDSDDFPFFGGNNNNNNNNYNRGNNHYEPHKKKKKKKNMFDKFIKVKINNIDESVPINDVNRLFNGCKCASQKILKGHGFLNFSNLEDAKKCVETFNGYKLGNKKLKLAIVNNH